MCLYVCFQNFYSRQFLQCVQIKMVQRMMIRVVAIRNKTSLLPVFSSIGIIDNGEGEGEDMLNKEAL